MIGTVAGQLATAETAILAATVAHPERRGALLVDARTPVIEAHRRDLPWIEGDWTGRVSARRLIHAARLAIASGDPETAVEYVEAIRRRWAR